MPSIDDKIVCKICGERVHSIQIHLRDVHTDVSVAQYQERYPSSPLLSEYAKDMLAKKRAEQAAAAAAPAPLTVAAAGASVTPMHKAGTMKKAFHEIFGLGNDPLARNAKGEAIPMTVLDSNPETDMYVPAADPNHVWDVDNLKNIMMAVELNMPLYLWGHMGTGKTTDIINICAATNRPALRVQHTLQTEESHILGQWILKDGRTEFNLGPLPLAMRLGLAYIADEYDFGTPGVMALYQPVLEPGGVLVIKDADPENRVIKPHPNFRFFATGNTNGAGDETGLYQGTQIQNAANYDRFGIVIQKHYMKPDREKEIIKSQAGINEKDAEKLVEFATKVREAFEGSKISNTCSPRTLINAARIGIRKANMRTGIALCFGNKLNKVDREVIDGIAQRIFGN